MERYIGGDNINSVSYTLEILNKDISLLRYNTNTKFNTQAAESINTKRCSEFYVTIS